MSSVIVIMTHEEAEDLGAVFLGEGRGKEASKMGSAPEAGIAV